MTLIVTSEYELNRIASPNLPLATVDYSREYQEQLNNVLRLFFNRTNSNFNQLQTADILPALTNYTVGTLPGAPASGVGARSFVTDATAPAFGATVIGGGTVATPVYSDGTNWKVG